jgi:hypothetical protein
VGAWTARAAFPAHPLTRPRQRCMRAAGACSTRCECMNSWLQHTVQCVLCRSRAEWDHGHDSSCSDLEELVL